MKKEKLYTIILVMLCVVIGFISYFILDIYTNQIFKLIMTLITLSIIGYVIVIRKVGSKFEKIAIITIGIICLLILITGEMTLGYFILLAPLYLLEWIDKNENNNPEIKKKIKTSFNIGIIFIILSIIYLLNSCFNPEISLSNIMLLGLGTLISLFLILEIKHKYFNKII